MQAGRSNQLFLFLSEIIGCICLSLKYLEYCVERELETLSDWFRANKLTLNVDKSVFLMFNRTGQRRINQLKLGDSLINRVSSTKFLGTWVDDQLNWKTHMSRLLSRLKCGLGMLQHSRDLLS